MKGWSKCELGDALNLKRGFDLPERDRQNGNVPVVSSSGITGFHNKPMVKAPGVVTGRYGTIGEVFFITDNFWPLNTSLYVENFKGNSIKFTSYLLKVYLNTNQNAAGAVPGVNRNHLHKIKISLPPLPIQRKIAAVLSAYDDLIENNNRRVEILAKMAKDLYFEWFVRLRFPGHEKVKIVKGVPEGWTIKRLNEIADITYGFPFEGSRFNSAGIGKPIIRIRNIPDSSTTDYTDEQANEKYIIRKGDLLVGMDGEFHINHWYSEDAYLVQRSCRIKAKNKIYEGYLAEAIYTPIKYFESILQGATVGHLGAKNLNSIDILMPSKKTDTSIFNKLIDQKVRIASANNLLSQSRNRLISRLMTGKTDVKHLDIQFPKSMKEEGTADA